MTDNLQDIIPRVLNEPTPAALRELQGALLAQAPNAVRNRALELAGHFFAYLSELQSKISARDYSEFASRLDVGAMGAVALESIVDGEGEKLWQRLMLGSVGEILMIAASRQYVKAWREELGPVHAGAIWYLSEALWHASVRGKPDIPAQERWQAIQTMLEPAIDPQEADSQRAVVLGKVFQLLLLIELVGIPDTKDQE
jgi:hypothetical protein